MAINNVLFYGKYICRLNHLFKYNENTDQLTLDPPTPDSPGTPTTPDSPGLPFNNIEAAKCHITAIPTATEIYLLKRHVITEKTYRLTGWASSAIRSLVRCSSSLVYINKICVFSKDHELVEK